MKQADIKKLKGVGFLILSLIVIYLSFPAWIGFVISSQLPEDVSLQSVDTHLPGLDKIFIKNIKVKVSNQLITVENIEFDYQLSEIKITQLLIEQLPESSSIKQTEDNLVNSLVFKLPIINHSDLEKFEQLNNVSIDKVTLKTKSQIIYFSKLKLNRIDESLYQLNSEEVKLVDSSGIILVSKLSSTLEVKAEQIKLSLYQDNQESKQSLVILNYQLTEQQLKLKALINYNTIKTLIPPEFKDLILTPEEEVTIDWIQNRFDNKLQISLSSLLKSSEKSFTVNENVSAKLLISTESEYFPLQAKVSLSLNTKNLVKLDSKQMVIAISPFTFNSNFNITLGDLTVDDAKLLLDGINYQVKLETINFQNIDNPLILNAEQVTVIGEVSNIDTSLSNLENSHWNLTGQVLLPTLSAGYESAENLSKEQEPPSNEGANNQQNLNDSVEMKAEAKIDFQLEKKSALKINGKFETNKMEINYADDKLKTSMKVNWTNVNENLSEGSADISLQSVEGNIAGLNYKRAKLISEILFSEKEINGKGNLSVNEQLLAPFSFDYNKELSDISITLQKNQLTNQMLNYFLKPFSKDAKIPLEIINGEVVHSASLELSDEMIVESIFNINDMSFNFGENNIYGLNLSQKLTSFSPIKLQSNLSIESVNFSSGLEITNINTKFDSGVNDVFETKTFSGELFKGKLFSKAIKFSADGIEQSIIDLKKISLTELIFFLEVQGLYADGNIDFSLPFSLKDGVIIIKDGNFKALDKGIIKYTYTDTDSGEEENIALKALKNFHYEALDGTFSYNKDGLYHMRLHLLGANPDLYDGYPVDFILNLRGELSGVFRSLFLTGSFEDAVMEQVKASNFEQ